MEACWLSHNHLQELTITITHDNCNASVLSCITYGNRPIGDVWKNGIFESSPILLNKTQFMCIQSQYKTVLKPQNVHIGKDASETLPPMTTSAEKSWCLPIIFSTLNVCRASSRVGDIISAPRPSRWLHFSLYNFSSTWNSRFNPSSMTVKISSSLWNCTIMDFEYTSVRWMTAYSNELIHWLK